MATTLDANQLETIKSDLAQTQEILTNDQVLALATKAIDVIKIPFGTEKIKVTIAFKIIRLVEKSLYKLLPNEYITLIHDSADGISEAEADALVKRLVPLVNKAIDIPILSEEMEAMAIQFILDLIIGAMVKGCNLGEK